MGRKRRTGRGTVVVARMARINKMVLMVVAKNAHVVLVINIGVRHNHQNPPNGLRLNGKVQYRMLLKKPVGLFPRNLNA